MYFEHSDNNIPDETSDTARAGPTTNNVDDDMDEDEKAKWTKFDFEFAKLYMPVQEKLSKTEVEPAEAATQFNQMLTEFLRSKPGVIKEVKTYFKHKPESTKSLDEAKKLKNYPRKKAKEPQANKEDKSNACEALRYYNIMLKKHNEKQETKQIEGQEKAYKRNFYKFAKEITNGTYDKPPVVPTFSKEEANEHYTTKYSKESYIDLTQLSWFPKVAAPVKSYDLTPYTSENIREALTKKTQDSAPGDDEILYDFLSKMPTTHTFLSTLFTNIRDMSDAPEIWGSSKIILITKDEVTNQADPTEFRMISLTANVGKLYHTLESSRAISFMITNK